MLNIIEMAATRQRLRDGILGVGCIGTIGAGVAAIDETIRGSLVDLFQGGLRNAAFLNELSTPMLLAQLVVQMFSSSVGLRTKGRTRIVQKLDKVGSKLSRPCALPTPANGPA